MNPKNLKEAVDATPDVQGWYYKGKQSLKEKDRNRISVRRTRALQGGVDIDTATKEKYPDENRWDYVVEYSGELHFIEPHDANSEHYNEFYEKLDWLQKWLRNKAQAIDSLPYPKRYHWVATGPIYNKILRTSPQSKRPRLVPTKHLILD